MGDTGLFLKQIQASGFASPTSLGAYRAVLHVRRMLFAFLSAKPTGVSASSKLGADEFAVGGGDATDDPGGGKADIRAVQIRPNTRHLLGYFVLSEAGVGARIACLSTRVAGGNALHRPGMIARRIEGMRLEHLLDVTHEQSFATAAVLRGLSELFSEGDRFLDPPILAVDRYFAGAFALPIFLCQGDRSLPIFGFTHACSVVLFDDPMPAKAKHVQTFIFQWHTSSSFGRRGIVSGWTLIRASSRQI